MGNPQFKIKKNKFSSNHPQNEASNMSPKTKIEIEKVNEDHY